MHIKRKTIILVLAALFLAILITIALLIKPLTKVISLAKQNKEFVEQGIKSIEVKKDLEEAITKKAVGGIDVLHYGINIELYPGEKKIKGDVTINMKLGGLESNKIDLDFYDNLKINNVFIDNKKVKYERSEKNLSVYRNDKLRDTVKIRVVYEGEPKSLGFGSFNFPKVDDKVYVYTMNEPNYASTWFPCIDIPTDKALTDMYITNDSSMVSLSNGKLIGTSKNGSRKTYHWKTYYPVSTYLIAIYSADYKTYSQKYVSITKDTVDMYCYATPEKFEDLKRDFSDHNSYMKIFEETFGPYAFSKEKYGLAEFWWEYGAMESQTITGIGSSYITGKKFFMDMMIHELSHHWWGDAVSPKSWKDIWLNEGFATYSEALYWEKKSGLSALKSSINAKFNTFNNGTLYNPLSGLFSRLIYDKGAWVLHMLRKEIGDDNFFEVLRQYFKTYEYKNASTADFIRICEQISKKNLKQFFDQWVYKGEGIIDLEYDWETEKNGINYSVKIYIEQLQNGYDIYKFPIDLKFSFEDGKEPVLITKYINKKEETLTLQLDSKPVKLQLDPDKWLLATINKK